MTPGARVNTSIDICLKIEEKHVPAESVLRSYFQTRRYVGARDRRYISDKVYTLLRHRTGLDWWVKKAQSQAPAASDLATGIRARLIAALVLLDRITADQMARLFSGNRHCPDPLSAQERALVEALEGRNFAHHEMPDYARYEYPAWLDEFLGRVWKAELPRQVDALNRPAALDLRVNTLRADRDQIRQTLLEAGLTAEDTPLSPIGLRLNARIKLNSLNAYRDGLVEVQDEGSQLISLLADARPGMRVVDFCAGGGGKTLAMAATMGDGGQVKGRLFACDVSERRLAKTLQRLRRAGIGSNVVLQPLHDTASLAWIDKNLGLAERVLVDGPCTGTGTWRRKPDSKWRLSPEGLETLCQKQRSIMRSARKLVKQGGNLIYATCSVLAEENEDQVAWFLENTPEFDLLPICEIWPSTVGGPCPTPEPWLRLTPADHGTDGFFCAVFKRH